MPDRPDAARLDELLDRALDLPPEARADFVASAAADDEALRRRLEAVLREDAPDDPFLRPGAAWTSDAAEAVAPGHDEDQGENEDEDPVDAPLLVPGQRVGDFEVGHPLGRGGMGEVFRARDLTLGREVALKVPRLSRAGDTGARLEREARLLAALNHPNIGAIHGVVSTEGMRVLVLELVEGPTLASRLERGPLPPAQVCAIGRQVGRAIEAAHAVGIVHRDLKPANIKITPGGHVKVLDFGLAKALAGDVLDGAAAHADDLSRIARSVGLVFGTAAYMSPEQVRGLPVDYRTDIWAYGCLLYEMLTGERTFSGRTTAEVLRQVLEREPDLSRLPASTPAPLARLVRRCLRQDPSRRLAHISDALLELDDAEAEGPAVAAPARRLPWAAVSLGLAIVALAGAAAVWRNASAPPPASTVLAVPLPPSDEILIGSQPFAAVSPDGRTLVYRASRDGVSQLFRRPLDSLEATPIRGTENGSGPFFSPDGQWLGFDADGTLKKVPLEGGTPATICRAPGGATAAWTDAGEILFATNTSRVLRKVSADGGEPEDVTSVRAGAGDIGHFYPAALPGGRTALVTRIQNAERQILAVDLRTGAVEPLLAGSQPHYLRSGQLVFARDGSLWTVGFDPRSLRLSGSPAQIAALAGAVETAGAQFAAGGDATLVFLPAAPAPDRTVMFVDRSGRAAPLALQPRPYLRASLSPDERRVALAASEAGGARDVWVADLDRGVMTRLTFDPVIDAAPIWSPDGRDVLFRSERDRGGIYRRAADGSGDIELVVRSPGPILTPNGWDPSGRTLLFTEFRGYGDQSIGRIDLDGGGIEAVLTGPSAQLRPQLSPDGRWLAYQSDESGRFEVYVRPYPDVETARWQVSTAGGTSPRWRADGAELFFYDGTGIAAARVRAGTRFAADPARRLVDIPLSGGRLGPDYDVTSDGQRFLVITETEPAGRPRPEVLILQHWLR